MERSSKRLKRTISLKVDPSSRGGVKVVGASRRRRRIPRMKPEVKEFQVFATKNGVDQSGETVSLNSIAEGDDYNNRTGRRISGVGVYMDIIVDGPSTTTANDFGFMAVVLDKQPNASLPTFATIFDISTANPGQAFKNSFSRGDRFEVLWLQPVATAFQAGASVGNTLSTPSHIRHYIPLKGNAAKTLYNSANAEVPNTGALILCAGSFNNSATSTDNWRWSYNVKYTFVDA